MKREVFFKILNFLTNKFNEAHKNRIVKGIGGKFDSGHQGIQQKLTKATIPKKKSKFHELTEEEKMFNKQLSQKRIAIKHVNLELKIFRIRKETYRNHQNRYQQKLKIMCGIFNLNNSY